MIVMDKAGAREQLSEDAQTNEGTSQKETLLVGASINALVVVKVAMLTRPISLSI